MCGQCLNWEMIIFHAEVAPDQQTFLLRTSLFLNTAPWHVSTGWHSSDYGPDCHLLLCVGTRTPDTVIAARIATV